MNRQAADDPNPSSGLVSSLSDERGFLAAILATSTQAIFAETLDGVILGWNEAATRLFGHEPWEVVGHTEALLVPDGDVSAVHSILARVREGEAVETDVARVTKAGLPITIRQSTTPVRDPLGNVIGAAVLCRPKSSPAAAAGLAFSLFAEQTSDLVFRFRPGSGGFDYVNPAIVRLSGSTVDEHRADRDRLLSLATAEDRATFETLLGTNGIESVRGPAVVRIATTASQPAWYSFRVVPVRDAAGRVIALDGIGTDISASRNAEREARARADRLQHALDSARRGLLDLDLRDRTINVTPGLAALLGIDPAIESLPILRWRSFLHPADAARVMLLIEDLATGRREAYETEFRIVTRTGGTRVMVSAGRVVERDPQGRSGRVVGTQSDVTEEREAERASREMEDRHWTLFENMVQGAIYLDGFGEITGANPAASEMLGIPVDQLIGRTPRDLRLRTIREDGSVFPPSEFPGPVAHASGREVSGVIMGIHSRRDARLRWVLAHAQPQFRPGEERPYLVHVTFTDITAMRAAQDELRASQERYRTIVENTPDIIARLDAGLRFLYISPAIRRYGSFDPASFTGRTRAEVGYPAELTARWDALSREVFDDGLPREDEAQLPAPEGPRDVLWRALPEKDASGRVATLVTIIQDVTARRHLELQFRQAQKMEAVGRLAGGVAHDFNNLLTAIRSYATFLSSSLLEDDPRRGDALEIERAAESASGLTRQLLAFSRKQVLQPRLIDLGDVVTSIEAMLRRLIREDVVLDVAIGPDHGFVRADRSQIEQVIVNLVINARDAMPKGGRIEVRIAGVEIEPDDTGPMVEIEPGSWVVLTVRDTGVGVPEELRSQIFEPFFTTKAPGSGSGLGLSTVYGIVKQSGGHILVDSTDGEGATFLVFLPRSVAAQPTHAGEVAEIAGGTEILLVAEDDDFVRNLAVRSLRKLGYTVLEGRDGHAAMTAATDAPKPLDLLLTDVIMPGMSGRQLARQIAAAFPGIAIVYMSGYADESITRPDLLEEDAIFIEKPFTPAALGIRVRQALDQRASRAATASD
jgi:two-component system, cell cycle sensor histidine kinase and response regulator CckA